MKVSPFPRSSGVALVTVMALVAVMTMLVIAILSIASTERQSASAYAHSVRARQLSETAVNLVIDQIREGTRTDRKTGIFGGAEPAYWSSQPGMIRAYNGNGFEKAYKLYSSSNMVVEDAALLKNESKALQGWDQDPARFVDLNAPAISYDVDGVEKSRHFPILDPRSKTIDQVEGFNWDNAVMAEIAPGTEVADGKVLPLPVEWLYMLKDGSFGTLDQNHRFIGERQATSENPMVARLAFWADDESCKVNLNTAAEGVPWDTPRVASSEAKSWSMKQPVTNEVQRYPGHPATTCLSSVLFPDHYPDPDAPKKLSPAHLEAIYNMAPKVRHGGTEGGEKASDQTIHFDRDRLYASVYEIVFNIARQENDFVSMVQAEGGDGVARLERARGFLTTRSNSPELTVHGRPRISLWPMAEKQGKRYRTIYDDTMAFCTSLADGKQKYFYHRTGSHLRHVELYVHANRVNIDLYRYLMSSVYQTIPGYGGSLAKKYGSKRRAPYKDNYYADDSEYKLDHFAIPLMMIDYIRSTNLHDGNVAEPYARVRDFHGFGQIASNDLVGRNLTRDNGVKTQNSQWHKNTLEPKGLGRIFTVSEIATVCYCTAQATLVDFDEQGEAVLGNEAGPRKDLEVIQAILSNKKPKYPRKFDHSDLGKRFKYIEVGIIPEFFCPMQGFHQIHPRQTVQLVTGGQGYIKGSIENWKINGIPLDLWGHTSAVQNNFVLGPTVQTSDPAVALNRQGQLPAGWFGWGGSGGYRLLRFGEFSVKADRRKYDPQFLANGEGKLSALYCQSAIVVEDKPLKMTCEKPIRFIVYASGSGRLRRTRVVQTLNIQFPETTFEAPKLNPSEFQGWSRRFDRASKASPNSVVHVLTDNDVVKSMILAHGDYRHLAARRNVPAELFQPHPLYHESSKAHSLIFAGNEGASDAVVGKTGTTLADDLFGRNIAGKDVTYERGIRPDFTFDPDDRAAFSPLLSSSYRFPIDPSITRDFDNGVGGAADGAYGNKPDDGADDVPGNSIFNQKHPYFEVGEAKDFRYDDKTSNFSPNRMVTSPVAFGSLPSAFQANAPWTCLLFRPNLEDPDRFPHLGERGNGLQLTGDLRSAEGYEVPQFASVEDQKDLPPDHLWLDLFWMPIVEPYPISGPFSTAGKINLNYQMMPFTYIKRATALHAALKSERILAIPSSAGKTYKKAGKWNDGWHHRIDANETLKQFEERFANGKAFMTASEICEQFLIPEGERWDDEGRSIRSFWKKNRLTGDNSLEAPYKHLYPRLTTRSNAFKVHITTQTLLKGRGTDPNHFVPEQDQVRAQYRGSVLIERFIDPNKKEIPDYFEDLRHNENSMERFYQYRVGNVKEFPH
ncbi:MAG: Verru_Chthon cassette protein A [Verrucomicrobiaceae bacterium]|nr:Verru_Chthon cassette protein A [Verrucomicrobiaceae bacterium]